MSESDHPSPPIEFDKRPFGVTIDLGPEDFKAKEKSLGEDIDPPPLTDRDFMTGTALAATAGLVAVSGLVGVHEIRQRDRVELTQEQSVTREFEDHQGSVKVTGFVPLGDQPEMVAKVTQSQDSHKILTLEVRRRAELGESEAGPWTATGENPQVEVVGPGKYSAEVHLAGERETDVVIVPPAPGYFWVKPQSK